MTSLADRAKAAALRSPWFEEYYLADSLPGYGYSPVYGEWEAILEQEMKSSFMAPFGSGKSTKLSFIETLKLLLRSDIPGIGSGRDLRILLMSANETLAKGFLSQIKRELQHNSRIIRDFGAFYDDEEWSKTSIRVKGRTRNHKEPTLQAVGLYGAWEGWRGPVMVLDDIVDVKSKRSGAERERVKDRFDAAQGRLEEDGWHRFLNVGTPWHHEDNHNRIRNDMPTVPTFIFPATLPDGSAQFPHRLSLDALDRRKARMHPLFYQLHYMMSWDSSKGSIFDTAWLHFVPPSTIPHSRLERVVGVDLAISESPDADFTVFALLGKDRTTETVYILDILRKRMSAPSTRRALEGFIDRHQPQKVMIEKNAYQRSLAQFFRELTPHHRHLIVETNTSKGKVERFTEINGLAVRFQNKNLVLPEQASWLDDFVEEYTVFDDTTRDSRESHDDQLDAIEIALRAWQRDEVRVVEGFW